MLLLMRHTALAISDVATLARARIRDGEILVFRQKTGNLVRLPLPPDLEMVLDALPPPRGMESEATHYSWNPATMTRRCVVGVAERTLAAVFKKSGVAHARADRFRHTLATEILSRGGSDQDAADVLGNSPQIIRKHYAKWNVQRQDRIENQAMGHRIRGSRTPRKSRLSSSEACYTENLPVSFGERGVT